MVPFIHGLNLLLLLATQSFALTLDLLDTEDQDGHTFTVKFRNFCTIFNQSNHRFVGDLIQSAPMLSGIYAVLDNDSLQSDVGTLFDVHIRTKRSLVRGLTVGQRDPFLSILLWDVVDWDRNAMVLICVLAQNRLWITLNVKESRRRRSHIVAFYQSNFGAEELGNLLVNKRTSFPASELPNTVWTLERRWYGAYFSSFREMKMCILSVCCVLLVYTSLWIFAV